MHRTAILIIVALVLFLVIDTMNISLGEGVTCESILIDIQAIPEEDTAVVTMHIRYNEILEDTFINVQLLPDTVIQILSIEDSNGNDLPYTFNAKNNEVRIYANNTNEVIIRYMVSNLVNEVSIGQYVMGIDLSPYTNTSIFKASIILLSKYNVTIIPSNKYVETSHTTNTTQITITKPGYYLIIINTLAEIPAPTTTPHGGETSGQQVVPPLSTTWIIPVIAILAVAIVAIAYMYYRRRTMEPAIITVPPGKLLEDETVKAIILATGDAGPEGIKQSQLVRITGRPKSTISRRLRRLAEEGYLQVIRSGKYNIVKLTPKGYETYKELKKKIEKEE